MYHQKLKASYFNRLSQGHFPGLLGITITHLEEGKLQAKMSIKKDFFAPNGYLHAGSLVTLADTVAGYATVAHLPEKGESFTTLELKSNFLGAAKEGTLLCECTAEHLGRTTQVWRAEVRHEQTDKRIAIFSCTQLILY
ncbi:MAG: PaaI family thioesterase [Bacteroidota bacterium]